MKTFRYLMSILAVLFVAASASALVVRIESVDVYNSPEVATLGGGLQSLIASRVADSNIEVRTTADPAIKPDWLIKTTITQLGGVYSVDAALVHAEGKISGERAFETVSSSEKLMEALGKVSEKLKKKLLAEASVSPGIAAAEAAAQKRPGAELLSDYKVEGEIKGEVLSLVSVDADDDSDTELLALVRGNILVLLKTRPVLSEIWRRKLDSNFYGQYASAGDYDGDGKLEIFVAGNFEDNVYTQAFRLDGDEPKPVGERVWGFLRYADRPEKGKILYGLPSKGAPEIFDPNLYYYNWNGKEFNRGEKIPTPDAVPPINVEWIRSTSGAVHLALTDTAGRLRIYDPEMKKLYSSEDFVKGGRVYFEGDQSAEKGGELPQSWEINTPSVEHGGLLYLHDNIEGARYTRAKAYDNGSIAAYRWDGVTLRKIAESPKFTGYFTAITLGLHDKRIYGALIKTTGVLTKEYTTQIIGF
ncbi:VCBS repeat-containing protein [bacterium]|nr:MAG: VCBS repeat-containing protein [bacterium]